MDRCKMCQRKSHPTITGAILGVQRQDKLIGDQTKFSREVGETKDGCRQSRIPWGQDEGAEKEAKGKTTGRGAEGCQERAEKKRAVKGLLEKAARNVNGSSEGKTRKKTEKNQE